MIPTREQILSVWTVPVVDANGRSRTPEERFWNNVYCDPNTGCFLWFGATSSNGYGIMQIRVDGHNCNVSTHRLSYLVFRGELGSLRACHSCDRPICVSPDHLWPGTSKDNSRDAAAKGLYPKGEAHGMSKLTRDQANEIRLATSESASALARKFNITRQIIWRVRTGRSWL